jgi:hypothetical protein
MTRLALLPVDLRGLVVHRDADADRARPRVQKRGGWWQVVCPETCPSASHGIVSVRTLATAEAIASARPRQHYLDRVRARHRTSAERRLLAGQLAGGAS